MRRWRRAGWLAAGIAAVLGLAGCAVSTESDQAAVIYAVHWGSATKFSRCAQPNQRVSMGGDDYGVIYPAGQRTYEFKEGGDGPPISFVTKDNVTMTANGVVTFALNTDCQALRTFHERIGRKYNPVEGGDKKIEDTDGWDQLLRTYLGQQLDRSMDQAAKTYSWRALYTSPTAKTAWEKTIGADVPRRVQAQAGGDFFCSPTYAGSGECGAFVVTIQSPAIPGQLNEALVAEQAAVAQNNAQKQRNAAVRTELESIRALVKVLGPMGYVYYSALKDDKVEFLPVPAGGSINVTPRGK